MTAIREVGADELGRWVATRRAGQEWGRHGYRIMPGDVVLERRP